MAANVGAEEIQGTGLTLFGRNISSKTLGIVMAVIGVGVAAYGTATFTLPLYDSLEQAKSQIAQKRTSVETKEKEVASKGNLPQRVVAAQQRNQEVLALLPNPDSMDVLLRDLYAQIPRSAIQVGTAGSVSVKNPLDEFRPTDSGATQGGDTQFRTKRFGIRFSATYSDSINAIQRIERLRPLLVVEDVKMVPNTSLNLAAGTGENAQSAEQLKALIAKSTPLLSTSFNLVAYVPLSGAELKALEAPKANPAKK
jgi:type IV pilus assembly protein PilO